MKNISIPALITVVYLLTNLVVPFIFKGEMIFIMNVALWSIVVIASLAFTRIYQARIWRLDKTVLQLATLIAVFQVFLFIFVGFFMGFGKNSNIWTPTSLAIYFPYLLIPLLGIEFSRAYLTATITKRKLIITLLLISLFYALITPTVSTYQRLVSPLAISEFLIKTFIPTIAISLLATYLAYLSGLSANLTYMIIPAAFTWFSPILPNLPWAVQSLLNVIAPTIGFLLMDQTVKPLSTRRIHQVLRGKKSHVPFWTVIALVGLVAIWSSSGMLGFTPIIVGSGSMQPVMNVGDIAIVVKAPIQSIKVGDIIQYRTPNMTVIHRVIDVEGPENSRVFITKGDANNVPDDPVLQSQVIGKVLFLIPKLGWISIYIKTALAGIISFFTNNTSATYIILAVTLVVSIFGIHKYRNQPLKKIRRKIRV